MQATQAMLPKPRTAAELARIISKGSIRRRADRRAMREAIRWLELITEIGSAVPPWVLNRVNALVEKRRAGK